MPIGEPIQNPVCSNDGTVYCPQEGTVPKPITSIVGINGVKADTTSDGTVTVYARVDNVTIKIDGTMNLHVPDKAITFAKIQDVSSGILLGRTTIGNGSIQELPLSSTIQDNEADPIALNKSVTVSPGNAIEVVGVTQALIDDPQFTINHADTSSQGNVVTNGASVMASVTLDTYGHVTGMTTRTMLASDLGALTAESDPVFNAQKGEANGVATLDGNRKIPVDQLPPVAITDTFVVASEAAMLALVAERGDVAVRTDLGYSLILKQEPANVLANWEQLIVPTGEVDPVFMSSPAAGISALNISHWNSAYGWGNHADAGYAPQTRAINTISGILGGGNLSADRTLSIDSSYVGFLNYYTKTDLQTPGSSLVHWNNITNKPAFNYIINGSTPQAGANFNISGSGIIGGNFTVSNGLTSLSGELIVTTTPSGGITFNFDGGNNTGDLFYRSAGGRLARLQVGPNGTVLGSNGTTPTWVSAGGAGTVTQVGIVSSDITVAGSPITGAGDITLTLPNLVSAGTYNNVTVDAKGRVTSGTNVSYLTAVPNLQAVTNVDKNTTNDIIITRNGVALSLKQANPVNHSYLQFLNVDDTLRGFFGYHSEDITSLRIQNESNLSKHILLNPTSVGLVGVGTTDPETKLHVLGDIISSASPVATAGRVRISQQTGGGNITGQSYNGTTWVKDTLYLSNNVDVESNLTVGGTVTASGGGFNSLLSIKNDLRRYEDSALRIVESLDIYRFKYNVQAEHDKIGLVINDTGDAAVKSLPEELLGHDGKYVDTYSFISILAKAIQELSEKINNVLGSAGK